MGIVVELYSTCTSSHFLPVRTVQALEDSINLRLQLDNAQVALIEAQNSQRAFKARYEEAVSQRDQAIEQRNEAMKQLNIATQTLDRERTATQNATTELQESLSSKYIVPHFIAIQ